MPEKKTISAREVVADIKVGMTDEQLMSKHLLSAKGLESLKTKLVAAGFLTQDQLNGNAGPTTVTPRVDKKAFARNIADAVKSGLPDNETARKFGISPAKLTAVYNSLIKAGYLTLDDLTSRPGKFEETVDLTPETVKFPESPVQSPDNKEPKTDRPVFRWLCPACKTPHHQEYPVCPQCGIIVEKFLQKQNPATAVETPTSKKTATVEGHGADEERIAETPVPPAAAVGRETLNKAAGQVVDKAKDLRNKIAGNSVFGRMLEFTKVPRNAAIIGGVCLSVLIAAYLVYTQTEQRSQQREAATIAFLETVKDSSRFEPNFNLIKDLLDQGANVNALIDMQTKNSPPDKIPALVLLSGAGHADTVRLLLERGANPNLRAQIGVVANNPPSDTVTALMLASRYGRSGIVMMLLKAGADPNETSGDSGKTALDFAVQGGHSQIVQILKAHGAKDGSKK